MNLSDDIDELELEILNVNNDIAGIDLQLDVNEIDATGEDSYFDWIKRAKTAKFYKTKELHQLKLKLKLLNKKAHKKKTPIGNVAHEAIVAGGVESKLNQEIEKTKRHQISEDVNLKVFMVFKKRISELLGRDRYIEIINECRLIVEGEWYGWCNRVKTIKRT